MPRISWPFRRRSPVLILPKSLSLDEYRQRLIGKEVETLAEHVIERAKFAGVAEEYLPMVLPDGRLFELGVAANRICNVDDPPHPPQT